MPSPIIGDRLGRRLLVSSTEQGAAETINENLLATIQQLSTIERRLEATSDAQAIARIREHGTGAGATGLTITPLQRDLPAGTEIVVVDARTFDRYELVVAEAHLTGVSTLRVQQGVSTALSEDSHIFLAAGFATNLKSETSYVSEFSKLRSRLANTESELRSVKEEVSTVGEGLDAKILTLQTEIKQTAHQIRLSASQTVTDRLNDEIERLEASLTVTATDITSLVSRVGSLDGEIRQAYTQIRQTAEAVDIQAKNLTRTDTELSEQVARLSVMPSEIAALVEQLSVLGNAVTRNEASIIIASDKITQTVSEEVYNATAGAQEFTRLSAPYAAGDQSLSVEPLPYPVFAGDTILILDDDLDKPMHARQAGTLQALFDADIDDETILVGGVVPDGFSAVAESPVYVRQALFTSVKKQTAIEISQQVLAQRRAEFIGTVTGEIAGTAVVTINVGGDGTEVLLTHGDTIVFYDAITGQGWEAVVQAGGEGEVLEVGASEITIIAQDFSGRPIPATADIYTSVDWLSSLIRQTADEIVLQVVGSSPFVVGQVAADVDPDPLSTSIALPNPGPGTKLDLRHNDILVITDPVTGVTTQVTVNSPNDIDGNPVIISAGAHSIPINSQALTLSKNAIISVGQLTGLNIALEGITVDGPYIASGNWDGIIERLELTDPDPPLGPADYGENGWALLNSGLFIATDAYLRGGLESTSGDLKLNDTGLFLPLGDNHFADAGTAWIRWTDDTNANAIAYFGAHHATGDTTTGYFGLSFSSEVTSPNFSIAADVSLQGDYNLTVPPDGTLYTSKIRSSADHTNQGTEEEPNYTYPDLYLEPTNADSDTPGHVILDGIKWPKAASSPVDNDSLWYNQTSGELEWKALNIYHVGAFIPGTLQNDQILTRYIIPTGGTVKLDEIQIVVGTAPQEDIQILVNDWACDIPMGSTGASVTSGSATFSGTITASVNGAAGGVADVSVTVAGKWV